MGQTQTPLKIALVGVEALGSGDVVESMRLQGHTIEIREDLKEYDFVAGPNCWFLADNPEVQGLFKMAVENARKVARARKEAQGGSKAKPKGKRKVKAKEASHDES